MRKEERDLIDVIARTKDLDEKTQQRLQAAAKTFKKQYSDAHLTRN